MNLLSTLKELEAQILGEFSTDRVWNQILWLDENIGQRLAGSPEEKQTAEYFHNILQEYGVPVTIYEFPGYVSFPKSAEIQVLEPEQKALVVSCYAQGKATPAEGLEGDLVYVGHGGLDDYKDIDAKGKFTLADLSYSPPRPEKVRIADRVIGSIGQIQINWGGDTLPLGTVKNVWGNPTPEQVDWMPKIPAVGINKSDGEYLKSLVERSKTRIRLKSDVWRGWATIREPVADITGTMEPELFVLLNGHYDAWGRATTCNATGNIAMLELARAFNMHRKKLRRSIRFAWWTAHETGIMDGSTWYLDNFWDDINKNCIAYMNCDSPGLKGTDLYGPSSMMELDEFHLEVVKDVLGEEEMIKGKDSRPILGRRPAKVGDQSFWGVGVPSIAGITMFPPERPALGEWYHSDEDSPDKVDLNVMRKQMKVYVALIVRLCNLPVLPINHVPVADELIETLTDLQDKGKGYVDLNNPIANAKEFKIRAQRVKDLVDKTTAEIEQSGETPELTKTAKKINKILMKLSRLLIHVNYTMTDRYEQDTYGRTGVGLKVAPLQPLVQLGRMDPKSDEFNALQTQLVRSRNKVADALVDASEYVDLVL